MDKNAIKEVIKRYKGKNYNFPLGCKAQNVETDENHEFWTPKKQKELEDMIETLKKILDSKANILTVNRTVYVSEAGSDENGDGSSEKPYRSIRHALENVPVINGNYEYKISVSAGTYSSFIAKNVSATIELHGDITITHDLSYSDHSIEVDDSNIKILGNNHIINLPSNTNSYICYIHNGGRVNIYKAGVSLSGNGIGTGINIISDGGLSQTSSGMSFSNLDAAVVVGTNSVFYSDRLSGVVTKGIIASNGGKVTFDTDGLSTGIDTHIITNSGGRVYTGTQDL